MKFSIPISELDEFLQIFAIHRLKLQQDTKLAGVINSAIGMLRQGLVKFDHQHIHVPVIGDLRIVSVDSRAVTLLLETPARKLAEEKLNGIPFITYKDVTKTENKTGLLGCVKSLFQTSHFEVGFSLDDIPKLQPMLDEYSVQLRDVRISAEEIVIEASCSASSTRAELASSRQ